MSCIAIGSDRRIQKRVLRGARKKTIERQCPTRGSKFSRPDHIHEKNVHLGIAVAQFLGNEIVEFG